MKCWVTLGLETYVVEVERRAGVQTVQVNGKPVEVDAWIDKDGRVHLLVEHRSYDFEVAHGEEGWLLFGPRGRVPVRVENEPERQLRQSLGPSATRARGQVVRAPMPGKIVAVGVKPGDRVRPGDVLLVQEAMKMENEIRCGVEGQVIHVHVQPGAAVESGAKLLEISS